VNHGELTPDADEAVFEGELIEAEIIAEEPEGAAVDAAGAGLPARLQPHDLGLDLPADHDEAVALLLSEVAAARGDADGYLEDLRRLAAEFENYRKRTAREQAAHVERASQRVVESLLPVLDSFDAAFTHDPQTPTEAKLIEGMRSTYQQLLAVVAKEGVEIIPTVGEAFDPEIHEAVSSPAGGDGSLIVAAELRRGYRLQGRVLRAALVALDHA